MPLYEYTCQDCNRSFELLLRGDETPACPNCGSSALEKLLSLPAAHAHETLPITGGPCGQGGCGRPECE